MSTDRKRWEVTFPRNDLGLPVRGGRIYTADLMTTEHGMLRFENYATDDDFLGERQADYVCSTANIALGDKCKGGYGFVSLDFFPDKSKPTIDMRAVRNAMQTAQRAPKTQYDARKLNGAFTLLRNHSRARTHVEDRRWSL